MRDMSEVEAAWVAGVIEGEGCFTFAKGTRRPNGQLNGFRCHVVVSMTDLDAIERLSNWTGMGKIHTRGLRPGQNKTAYVWTVAAQEEFRSLCQQIEPYMLSRRKARMREVLAELDQWQLELADRKRFCKNGHERAVFGVTLTGYCKECRRLAAERASQKKAGV